MFEAFDIGSISIDTKRGDVVELAAHILVEASGLAPSTIEEIIRMAESASQEFGITCDGTQTPFNVDPDESREMIGVHALEHAALAKLTSSLAATENGGIARVAGSVQELPDGFILKLSAQVNSGADQSDAEYRLIEALRISAGLTSQVMMGKIGAQEALGFLL